MSQIASVFVVRETSVERIREAAVPRKRWFGKPRDVFWDTLREVAVSEHTADVSGLAVSMLIECVRERDADSMNALDEHPLGDDLSEARASFFAAAAHEAAMTVARSLSRLEATPTELGTFANEFNQTDDDPAEFGAAMMSARLWLQRVLESVAPGTLALLHIG